MKIPKDITGQRFGKWTAIRHLPEMKKKGSDFWLCHCDCGTEKPVNRYFLGKVSNGCAKCARRPIDISGQKFGKYTVIKYRTDKNLFEVRCDCGQTSFVQGTHLLRGIRTKCRHCVFEDLTGQRFGSQTVIRRDYPTKSWLVRCDCGEEKLKRAGLIKVTSTCGRCESKRFLNQTYGKLTIVDLVYFKSQCRAFAKCDCGQWWYGDPWQAATGKIKSCGCLLRDFHMESAKNLIGQTFGELTVKKIEGYLNSTHRILFRCKCSCGKEKLVRREDLSCAKSCGCLLEKNRPRGENSGMAKLKNLDAEAIREMMKGNSGYSLEDIAKMYNVSHYTIRGILNKESYIIDK